MNDALMPYENLPDRLKDKLPAYQAMTVEQLESSLAKLLQLTADTLLEVALVVRLIEEKGGDVSALHIADVSYLRLIANSQMLPEVLIRFGGDEGLMKAISGLPIPDQRRMVAGERLKVLAFDEKGQQTHILVHPLDMTPNQIKQVFADRSIRTEAQQVAYLHDKRAQEMSLVVQEEFGTIKIDVVTDEYIIGRHRGPMADLARAVQAWKRAKKRKTRRA